MLPLEHRLPLRTTRRTVEAIAKSFSSPYFTFLVANRLTTNDDRMTKYDNRPSRFAVIISKKISAKAVTRNLYKRQILAAIQELLLQIKPGFDVIILAKKSLLSTIYPQIKADVENLLKKSGLL